MQQTEEVFKNTKNRRKILAVITEFIIITAILITGTFALFSAEPYANYLFNTNHNPGGRMHNHFDGENKNVFAENFGQESLLVRIRMSEWMELNGVAIPLSVTYDDKYNWTAFAPQNMGQLTNRPALFGAHVDWLWGASNYFMPTTNLDPMSPCAEVSGIGYCVCMVCDGAANAPGDGSWEQWRGNSDASYTLTPDANRGLQGVMTMDHWIYLERPIGNFWVIDTDGWAYWANWLDPGNATSLLLRAIEVNVPAGLRLKYSTNGKGQFTSVYDGWDGNEFGSPSSDAQLLIDLITNRTELIIIDNPYQDVDWAEYSQFRAALHVHTTRSDGDATFANTVRDHYNKGFDILAVTDHNLVHAGPWDSGANALSSAEAQAIMDGTYGRSFPGTFPAPFGPAMRRPQANGMIYIPHTNEQSRMNHINTFWTPFNNAPGDTMESVLQQTTALGGVAIINHPGRYTGGSVGGAAGENASNNPVWIDRYVDLHMQFPSLLGMEIFSLIDYETRSDRILWDNVLMRTMPYGRNVFGFANDDSHALLHTGINWNVLLMPELTQQEARRSLETGAFYTVTRIDRRLGVNNPVMVVLGMLNSQVTPGINNIVVADNAITITGRNYNRIEWVASGQVIHTGATLDLVAHLDSINHNYVRAQIISTTGVAMTQPFGVR